MTKAYIIDDLLDKALNGQTLEKGEIIELLSIKDKAAIEKLYKTAREIRKSIFSHKVFLYGFVYFSNHCKNDCNFCYSRKSNRIKRYRKSTEEIVAVAKGLANSGVNLIDLTMGEDANYHKGNFKTILRIINKTKEASRLPVMISPGVINKKSIDELSELGVEWFALYQETHNRELFNKLRVGQDYDKRMDTKIYAKKKGMLLEEGILVGVGEGIDDIAYSILEMGRIGADQVRVMSFIPQRGIPMENVPSPDRDIELKTIALLRLIYPQALIPASLDVDGISGLKSRINAGANVVTSIIPPKEGLLGVAQHVKNVDDGHRRVNSVVSVLSELELFPASPLEYGKYIDKKRCKND